MRKIQFVNHEIYHVYNRGVDKRSIFIDDWDYKRFLQSMEEFNSIDLLGSLYESNLRKKRESIFGNPVSKLGERLVDFVCYCLNPNHYHYMLIQLVDGGIQKFMHRLGLGYAKYFNEKYERTGSLFEGRFKAIHVDSREYLIHLSAYVNLNDQVHGFGNRVSKSSYEEFINGKTGFCNTDIVLREFSSPDAYKNFAPEAVDSVLKRRDMDSYRLEKV